MPNIPFRWSTRVVLCVALVAGAAVPGSADPIDDLSRDFWVWRAGVQPSSGDDIPRIERPAGWLPDWSAAAMAARRATLEQFERRYRAMSAEGWPVARQVDYRLVGSALARVRWELEVSPAWRRDPAFYIQQALGPVFDVLLPPPPVDAARAREVARRLTYAPVIVEQAMANLDDTRQPFARLAITTLDGISGRLEAMAQALDARLPAGERGRLAGPAQAVGRSLERYRAWLLARVDSLPTATAVGRDAYVWFLREVALVPFTPEELVAMGAQERDRAVAFEVLEQGRNRNVPPLALFPTADAQIAASAHQEQAVRDFLGRHQLLTIPSGVGHYRNLLLPDYLAPLAFLGVTDDLTSDQRLAEDGISYIRTPAPTLPYFYLSTARDPRPIIVHEGVPGHYLQLVLGWRHENPIRRRYYDSGANEGVGFYAEELLLQAGLWDDSPRSREIIYNFMRLRALRVEVDVKLATGTFAIADAADYLARMVPMDHETALEEAASFAAGPGQAITYQTGKVQIVRLLADARRAKGEAFSLRDFHDAVWKNGNVPFSLLRWELLGDKSDVERLATLK